MKISVVLILSCLTLGIISAMVWRFSSRRFTLPCPVWLGWLVELDNPFTKANQTINIIDHLELISGMHVLDAGCGPGRLTIALAKRVGMQGEVVAVDMQQKMLQRVQKKAQAEGLCNIKFVHAKIGDGHLGTSEYDRALLVTVLGEIPDRIAALKEIFKALKPGGLLSITEIILDPHFQSQKTVLRLATSVGFQRENLMGNRFAFTLQLKRPHDS